MKFINFISHAANQGKSKRQIDSNWSPLNVNYCLMVTFNPTNKLVTTFTTIWASLHHRNIVPACRQKHRLIEPPYLTVHKILAHLPTHAPPCTLETIDRLSVSTIDVSTFIRPTQCSLRARLVIYTFLMHKPKKNVRINKML